MSVVREYLPFALGLAVLATMTLLLARWARLGLGWLPGWALVRATVQLSIIALLLRGVLAFPVAVIAFLALMLTTASLTASGRLRELPYGRRYAVIGVLSGALVTLLAIFAMRLFSLEVRYLIAIAGIIIGNCMSAATLSGRHFMTAARQRRDEIEGWFALGATPSQAHDEIARTAARESLLPNLDQSRTTGLVTLPGAFVGALFGGASPASAAQFQLVVLAGIALGMTITSVIVTRLAGRSPTVLELPDEVSR